MTPPRLDDGLPLAVHIDAPTGPARGNVLVVHGLGEHAGRHDPVARFLNEAGWRVFRYDQRGHGDSGGRRGQIGAADDLLRDLGAVVGHIRTTTGGPLVLLGHSLGGLVCARFVAEGAADPPAGWWLPVQALALSSPALALRLAQRERLLLELLTWVAPWLAVGNRIDPEWLSQDPSVVEAYRSDPKVHDRVGVRLLGFMLDAAECVHERAPRWPLPTLLQYSAGDRCVDPEGSVRFAALAGDRVQAHRWIDMRHELFNEPQRARPLEVLGQWLRQVTA
jgi:alpha-beta hydrolase superfamily lysophospholipase